MTVGTTAVRAGLSPPCLQRTMGLVADSSHRGFPGGSTVRNPLPAQEPQETQVQSLGREDSLEEEMATHSSASCLENPVGRRARRAAVHGVTKAQTRLSMHARA